MSNVLEIKGNPNECVRKFFKHLLDSGKVEGIFALGKQDEGFHYLLVTDSAKLDDIYPFTPFMPENAANLLSRLTSIKKFSKRIAVFIRPCELRAFIELVKREQATRENIIFISPICGGVLTFKPYAEGNLENALPDYWKAFSKKENATGIRPTCGACEHFIPLNADITVFPVDDSCEFYLNTPLAEEVAKDAPGETSEGELDETTFAPVMDIRKAEKEKLFEQLNLENFGIDGLIDTYGRCLGCHGCGTVCPICFCALCTFDAKENEFTPALFENELIKRGAMRIPPNTIFYQLGRVTHMGISCVGCGMCSDVCPADIPVSSIFLRVGEASQAIFDYLPGKDYEEPVPLAAFVENELTDIED